MKIKQTNPSGKTLVYDLPDTTAVAQILAGWTHRDGVTRLDVHCGTGETWGFEKVEP